MGPATSPSEGSYLLFDAVSSAPQSLEVVTEARSWRVTSEDSWLRAIKSDGTITVSCEDNVNPDSRTGHFTVSGDRIETMSITVVQDRYRKKITLNPESLSFSRTDTKAKDMFVVCEDDDWTASLTDDEHFTLSVNGNKLTVTPKSVNETEDPRLATIIVDAGELAEPFEASITQKGVVDYFTFFAEWQVSGEPCVRVDENGNPDPGPSSWSSTFGMADDGSGENQWYVSPNFGGGGEEMKWPFHYSGETLYTQRGFLIVKREVEGRTILGNTRIFYLDENDVAWDVFTPVAGRWDGTTKTVSFGQKVEHFDGRSYDLIFMVVGYDAATGVVLGSYTDGYKNLTFTRGEKLPPPTRAAAVQALSSN
jgi:hypothetical protein